MMLEKRLISESSPIGARFTETSKPMKPRKPPLRIQPTTLWEYPSQDYGDAQQGRAGYKGATPSYIIWNLLQRYTSPNDLVIDPCAGSGTTLDVARDLGRRSLGYDVHPARKDIFRVDARKLPPELTGKADFVFIDPPYSTHLDYGPDPRDIGKLDAAGGKYYEAMELVIAEIYRVLKPGRYMALYVGDSFVKGQGFHPLGFELFGRLAARFQPVDIISVVRHNKTLEMGNYRKAAEEGNFFLRGFNYLFIMKKENDKLPGR
jgi:adenine-specific DNA-methyltransferase